MGKRVLIVGCGYVGLPLGHELVKEGHQVFGLRRSATADAELTANGVTPLHADISDAASLASLPRDYDWVVNCAATSGGTGEDYQRLYHQGTKNLIEWLRDELPRKYVHTSSTSVYGQNDGSLVVETDPVAPLTETSKVLVATENLLLDAASSGGANVPASRSAKHFSDGSRVRSPHPLPAVILRVAGIYGPGRGYWLKQFLSGEARLDGDGSRYLNMIHRDDVVGAIIKALKGAPVGSVCNVVDNEPVKQRDLFAWLAAKLNKPMPPSAPADEETIRKRGVTNKRVSNQRLKQQLGFQYKYPTFRQGYTAEIQQMRMAGKLS